MTGRDRLLVSAAVLSAELAGQQEGQPGPVLLDVRWRLGGPPGKWLLRYFGHQHVRVLDGGYQAWLDAGLPVSTADPAGAPGDFTARPGHMPLLDAASAGSLARTGLLLDARAGERYRGEQEVIDPVAGHIPGAVSAPTAGNVNPDGTFRAAAHEVLALALAGIPAALYLGSWSNWITDPARPVATGS